MIAIYPPGHQNGHPTLWLWEKIVAGVSVACGTTPDRQEAFDQAELAVMP